MKLNSSEVNEIKKMTLSKVPSKFNFKFTPKIEIRCKKSKKKENLILYLN